MQLQPDGTAACGRSRRIHRRHRARDRRGRRACGSPQGQGQRQEPQARLQDTTGVHADADRPGREGDAADHRGRDLAQRLPVRVDPGRHRARTSETVTCRRLRQPRNIDGAVPVRSGSADDRQLAQRLHNALVSKLTLSSRTAGVLRRDVRDPVVGQLPAVLLELLRRQGAGLQPPHPVHQRRGAPTSCTGRATPGRWRPPPRQRREPRAGGCRGRLRREERAAYRSIYGMGRYNHENAYPCPATRTWSSSRATTHSALPRRRCTSTPQNGQAVWTTRARSGHSSSDDPAVNDYGDLSGSEAVSGRFIPVPRMIATGKKADGTDAKSTDVGFPTPPAARASRRAAVAPRALVEHEQRVPVHPRRGHRLRPERTGTSCTSPTPASRGRCPTRPPAGSAVGRRARRARSRTGESSRWCSTSTTRPSSTSLSILIDADVRAPPATGALDLIHQPDNVETTKDLLCRRRTPAATTSTRSGPGRRLGSGPTT